MSDRLLRIEFNANPMQGAFIQSRARADLFSSRMGEGKSAGLCWSVFHHTRLNPGAVWVIIRDTFENLQRTTMKEFFKWFPPGVMGTYHTQKKCFTWADGVARGEVFFMGMDGPQDAASLMSMSIAGFCIDEPSPAIGSAGVDEMIFDIALGRRRQEGMKWYAAKLAQNNPDEAHWTYRRFISEVNPDDQFKAWQTQTPENIKNLPDGYYNQLRNDLRHRPDLVRRFVEGQYGFQQEGHAVTPQWEDKLHLSIGLTPIPRLPIHLLWDFGHHPACVISQVTPLGAWNILECHTGDGIGVAELVEDIVKPIIRKEYLPLHCPINHIGDPSGEVGDQTFKKHSPIKMLRTEIGGPFRKGPIKPSEGIEPLRGVLTRTVQGRGLVQVDRHKAAAVWHALRGGWHFHVARTGVVATEPKKNHPHSDVGDAMRYGAAILFPLGKVHAVEKTIRSPKLHSPWGRSSTGSVSKGRPSLLTPVDSGPQGAVIRRGNPLFVPDVSTRSGLRGRWKDTIEGR